LNFKELLNLDMRDEDVLIVEAKKRELRRDISLLQAVRFGMHASAGDYEQRLRQLEFEVRKYEEEY